MCVCVRTYARDVSVSIYLQYPSNQSYHGQIRDDEGGYRQIDWTYNIGTAIITFGVFSITMIFLALMFIPKVSQQIE